MHYVRLYTTLHEAGSPEDLGLSIRISFGSFQVAVWTARTVTSRFTTEMKPS